ncbi:GntR family transcriptional regulator [Breznakiella homolactica]|uniref:GntR family transcriptional regulator n=1 Tax=Breznakiella homolactica TaxID=2798577 RepID=A0A7T7XQY6_9SPIR|nr:GntR family transcriptional regulator [Breznakiella homolactica]QQO10853.1 GntR family transcriptional regulator [Breznakiella homolactica]
MADTAAPKELNDNSILIFRTLKNEILNLTIPPGTVISENEICERFSVSRTPVRTAFQRLSDAKLIKNIPYRETTVTRINLNHIRQIIYMRIAIESKVIRDFIDQYDPFAIEKIRYGIRKQLVLLGTEFTPPEFYTEDSSFHRIWFRATDKELLWRKIQHAQVHYTRFRMLDIVEARKFSAIEKEHEQLFSIIQKKDKDGVEPFMTKHLNGGIQRLGKRIYREFSDYFEDTGPDFMQS